MTFSNARSIASGLSSAPISRAMSMNRWYSAGSSGVTGASGLRAGMGGVSLLLKADYSHLGLAAFLAGPPVLAPRIPRSADGQSDRFPPHSTFSAAVAGFRWLFLQLTFKGADARFQRRYPVRNDSAPPCVAQGALAPSDSSHRDGPLKEGYHV